MKTIILIVALLFAITKDKQDNCQSVYRGNPQHTGCYEGAGIGLNSSVVWKFKTGDKVISSPVIYNETLFIGSDDCFFYAIDKKSGNLKWKFKTKGRVSSSAAVFNKVVYINSFDGFVYALDVENGKLIWKFDTGGDKVFSATNLHGIQTGGQVVEDPWDMYLSSPVVAKGKVFVGSGNGYFWAINAKTGQLDWKFRTEGVIHSSPAISGDSVYFASWDSYIYALNCNNGSEIWRFKTGTDDINHNQVGFQSSPAISGNMLYIGCRDGNLRAIDRISGKLKWLFSANGSWIITAPAVYNNRVYFGTSDTNRILSLDSETGKIIFDKPAKSYIFSSPAIAGNKLYVGTFAGFLYEMDCISGKTRAVFSTEASTVNGKVYLNPDSTFNTTKVFPDASWNGMLQSVKNLYSMGSILSSPAIDGSRLYFGSTDGFVYALE